MSKNYFECKYRGPYKGVNTQLPEDLLTPDYTPFMNNFSLKNGEIRSRPRQSLYIPGPPDGKPVLFITSFMDANNVYHTCIVTATGLWQLNRPWQNKPITSKKSWSLIGAFTEQPGANNRAGFNDELDVPDSILGAFTVGTTAFILRQNGITEVTSTGQGINPFNFNHLWASDRGIGNIFPFGYASYGPLGIFISSDDIYNVSLGGFNRIGGMARDAIYKDLYAAIENPIGSIIPYYQLNYVYNHYKLVIPQAGGTRIWNYSIEDSSWQTEFKETTSYTGHSRYCF